MVGVEQDGAVVQVAYGEDHRFAPLLHAKLTSDLELELRRQLAPRNAQRQLVAPSPVRLGGRNRHPLRFADRHPVHGVVETLDHRSLADGEGQRIHSARAVELLAVVQRSGVMHPDGVSSLCLRHLCSGESRAPKDGVCAAWSVPAPGPGAARSGSWLGPSTFRDERDGGRSARCKSSNPASMDTYRAPSPAAPKVHCRGGNYAAADARAADFLTSGDRDESSSSSYGWLRVGGPLPRLGWHGPGAGQGTWQGS